MGTLWWEKSGVRSWAYISRRSPPYRTVFCELQKTFLGSTCDQDGMFHRSHTYRKKWLRSTIRRLGVYFRAVAGNQLQVAVSTAVRI